jgi:oligopeptidase B
VSPTNKQEATTSLIPPIAAVQPVTLEKHGQARIDPYYWLNDRENPDVIAYLHAENDYTQSVMAHQKKLEDELFEEIKGRIQQTDLSVPYKLDDYFYYTRFEEGKEYPVFCRKKESLDAKEQVILDANVLAEGHEYFAIGGMGISYKQNLMAYAYDTQGRRVYTIRYKNLDTGELLADTISGVSGNMAWANDNQTLFYGKQDPTTLRSHQIFRHILGTDPAKDVLVYEEEDDTFAVAVFKTKSKRYVMIASHQTVSSEYRYVEADDPAGVFKVFLPRSRDHEYDLEHYQDSFYIRTNWQAKNFRLMKTFVSEPAQVQWQEVIAHRDDVLLESFELFRDHLVVEERKQGLVNIRIMPWSGEGGHYLDFGEPTYLAGVGENPDFNTSLLRFGYTSMTTPNSVFDYDMVTREKTLLKQEEVLGGFDCEKYCTERVWATAADGKRVPISLVYQKGCVKDGNNSLLLYGYGSYGACMDANFSSPRLSLLDRGFVFAIAHIRGGEELGRHWYEDGKLLRKKNTFTDFIACAEHLITEGYTCPEKLFAMGGSAGGLLIGAVVNMRPELFKGAVAQVPFVDVITTMLDPNIPLTTGEYDEWGDPNQQNAFEYILSYSPYDNVEAKAYPHLLITTGLHDSQVQYWEPAKWVAKLRTMKTDHHRLLLKTNMDAGHGGASGRFRRLKELAFIYTFLLDLVDA